ncbi:MAG: 3'-5' exonuclease [Deltaproteobacteria bacterium]|nr:3'-5' exonuclease [Deltaproteobacteria bacterium]
MADCDNALNVVVLDFETTGLSPSYGDRAIEIGAVKLKNGEIIETFQELMNPGFPVNNFIAQYTGITNSMLKKARRCNEVMKSFAEFLGDSNFVAHNASFDERFLRSEFEMISRYSIPDYTCSMLCARRIYPDAPSHKLSSLVSYKSIREEDSYHRALQDSIMTSRLWTTMINDIREKYNTGIISFSMMKKLSRMSKKNMDSFFRIHP